MLPITAFACSIAINWAGSFAGQYLAAIQIDSGNVRISYDNVLSVVVSQMRSDPSLRDCAYWLEETYPGSTTNLDWCPIVVPCQAFVGGTERCECDNLAQLHEFNLLRKLPFLQRVDIAEGKVTRHTIKQIASCDYLQSLIVYSKEFSSTDLPLLRKLRYLRHLDFNAGQSSLGEGVEQLTGLSSLVIRHVNIDAVSVRRLTGLKNLEVLELLNCSRNDIRSPIDFSGWEHLWRLNVDALRLAPHEWSTIAGLKSLHTLVVSNDDIESRDLVQLQRCNQLECVTFNNVRVEEGCFDLLAKLPQLRIVNIYNSTISDADLGGLGKLAKLEQLRIENNVFSDSVLKKLRLSSSMRVILLKGKASKEAIGELKALNPSADVTFIEER